VRNYSGEFDNRLSVEEEKMLSTNQAARKSCGEKYADHHFLHQIQDHLGAKYKTIGTVSLWEMRLMVLSLERHARFINNIQKTKEATGIGHVLGNKGGLLFKMDVYGCSVCFVTCHLAAHEGSKNLARRNSDVSEIMRNARVGKRELDLCSQYHYAFWFGDLNYRIDLQIGDGNKRTDHAEHREEVKQIIAKKNIKQLMSADELQDQIKQEKVLVGWNEHKISFLPTFKVQRHQALAYKVEIKC